MHALNPTATARFSRVRELAPGMAVSITVAAAATFLSEHYGAPVLLFALLLGMGLNFLSAEGTCKAGIDEHQKWLETVLVPGAKGEFRLGAALYDAKLAFALNSPLSRALAIG